MWHWRNSKRKVTLTHDQAKVVSCLLESARVGNEITALNSEWRLMFRIENQIDEQLWGSKYVSDRNERLITHQPILAVNLGLIDERTSL